MEQLSCVVQEYAWGDTQSIPHLLGQEPDGQPKAELWMGAHPRACSDCVDGGSLADLIAGDPTAALGTEVNDRFGQLPFLFKVLAAGEPLSIQSHPTLDQAIEGFARENEEGIPLDAPHRVYRDPNHKPEVIAALTPFHAKCGFRPLSESRQLFSLVSALDDAGVLKPITEILFEDGAASDVYANAMAYILGAPASTEIEIASATTTAAAALLGTPAGEPFASELEWTGKIAASFPDDTGVTVALMLNHVFLEPGQAIFLEAGNLHAYLNGVGMELMANSDNVVRGGLTPKHRDIAELLKVVDCSPIDVPIQIPTTDTWTYHCPVPEFTLQRLVNPSGPIESPGPEIIFVQQGDIEFVCGEKTLVMTGGDVVWLSAEDAEVSISGQGTLWRATV